MTQPAGRDARALRSLDWLAAALVAAALIWAPVFAGVFPTPPHFSFAPAGGTMDYLNAVGVPAAVCLPAIAFLFLAWREWRRSVSIGAVPGLGGAVAVLCVLATVSLARSRAPYMSFNALAALSAAVLLGGLISRLARDRAALTVLLCAMLCGASSVAALGINEYLQKWREGAPEHRTFATFTNPDFLAGYLVLILPVCAAAFVAARDRTARLALGVALILQSACLLLTGSRAGALMAVVALVVWVAIAVASRADRSPNRVRAHMGLAVMLFVAGAALASTPTRLRVAGNPSAPAVSHAAPGGVMSAVESTAAAQGHSAEFRRYTWMGAVAAIKANPLIGFGLGAFEVSYPRYAITAFTAHAHNSFLQWTAETGVLGGLLLLTVLAAATAFAAHSLRISSAAPGPEAPDPGVPPPTVAANGRKRAAAHQTRLEPTGAAPLEELFEAPRLLLAGLLAGIFASMLHSLFDSDWYIVGTLFALSGALALAVALARDITPLSTQMPRPLGWAFYAAGGCVTLFVLWRGVSLGIASMDALGGADALTNAHQPDVALAAYRSAAAADAWDPEYELDIAQIDTLLRRPADAERDLLAATRRAGIGKAYYRLGRFYAAQGDLPHAIEAFQHARDTEPHNLQTLNALADALANAGRTDAAVEVYRSEEALENAPYGTVRAVPEQVETEFAYPHVALAGMAAKAGRWQEAAAEYAQADRVLNAYFATRNFLQSELIAPEKRQALADLYERVLAQRQAALAKLGPGHERDIAKAAADLRHVRDERAKDAQRQ